jgi:hypothetical protein
VGWGGATDQHGASSSVVHAIGQGAAAAFEGCTLRYHPDSEHMPTVLIRQGSAVQASPGNPLPSSLVVAEEHGRVDMSQCQLMGPALKSAVHTGFGIRAGAHASVTLVGVCWIVISRGYEHARALMLGAGF